ncbi:MAG TPA: DUF523 domain-containing protein [Aquifex sp.]|uniref:DUF523 domain-containing protein n=1 Tax=Aquifex aeolicus TaxID=63363 RepID=A0A9D0YNG7_AQUAO|nr:DUF523 domain-containing protein [Aquifex sp.]HIP98031.1 DUF523 domain-containing protein [Aquifex aeolicus]
MEKVLVSACLLGINCRYDGKHKLNKFLLERLKFYEVIPICPETEGGLPTPREPATREGDKVITNFTKRDVTPFFKLGALKTLERAKRLGIKKAFLKSKSPSCGENGITAQKLREKGITLEWF